MRRNDDKQLKIVRVAVIDRYSKEAGSRPPWLYKNTKKLILLFGS